MNNFKHIEINIGKACNNRCKFCMSSKSKDWDSKFTTLDVLKQKIDSYAKKGYNSIGFLGGDISIHPQIIDIISYCKNNGFININIVTNGVKFSDYEFTKKVVEAGLTRVNFSIHSHLDEVEDYLTQVKGGLKKKLKAIDNFNEFYNNGLLRDNLSINIVLNRKNLDTIIETVLYFYKVKKINDIRINFIWLNDDNKENWEELTLSYSDFSNYMKKLVYISLKYNIRITFDTIPPCIFYSMDKENYRALLVRFLGENLDYISDIDNINNNDQFNWKERKKDILKTQFDQCESCIYKISCQGVRKSYKEIYGGAEFSPIKIINSKEKKIKQTNVENNNKKYSLDDFDDKIKIYYKENKEILDKYNYINNFISKLD
ncbi:radical SAM protein [Candidatus Gracilibacteria bacterium]|nr:radical SAM protein [Candidatus Gracilibacteria bacterium]